MSSIAAVTEAVRIKLSQFGGIPAVPVRTYQPLIDFKHLGDGDYAIQVMAGSQEFELISREAAIDREYRIDVAVSRKTDKKSDNAGADEAMTTAEYLIQYMKGEALSISALRWVGVEQEAAFVPEHFKDYGVLTTVFTLVYQAFET